MTGSGQSHNFLDDKTNTGKGIVIMDRNTTKYKVKQYIMFAGISTVLFAAVVIIPFIYGLYLTFTSWDGISKDKQFVGFANYIATFKDIAYWQALGRTVIYSVISVVLVNVVAFFLAYLLTSGIKGQNFFRAGFFIPNLIGGMFLVMYGSLFLTEHLYQLERQFLLVRFQILGWQHRVVQWHV